MKKLLLMALLACGLVACTGQDSQTRDDEEPTEETTEADEVDEEEAEEVDEADEDEASKDGDLEAAIEEAATGDHRSDENIARNEYRNPVETLMFFGIEPDMTVIELWPGSGWYTEVLAPVLSDGQLIAASFAPDPDDPDDYRTKIYEKYDERLAEEEVFSNVRHGMLEPPEEVDIGEPESADMALSFRSFHNWIDAGIEDDIVAEVYEALEPGGIFGIVQHRAEEGADVEETAEDGYVPEAYVIETLEEAGFELVDSSEINANPDDTRDHPEGVWTLPPSYRLGDEDREKYEEIGESDRMTLKFQKPE